MRQPLGSFDGALEYHYANQSPHDGHSPNRYYPQKHWFTGGGEPGNHPEHNQSQNPHAAQSINQSGIAGIELFLTSPDTGGKFFPVR